MQIYVKYKHYLMYMNHFTSACSQGFTMFHDHTAFLSESHGNSVT